MWAECILELFAVAVCCDSSLYENVIGCDRLSLNSLCWGVDAPITHPFCTRKLSYQDCTKGAGYSPTPSAYTADYYALLFAINLLNRKVKKYGNV